jgi:hypothetical protein
MGTHTRRIPKDRNLSITIRLVLNDRICIDASFWPWYPRS